MKQLTTRRASATMQGKSGIQWIPQRVKKVFLTRWWTGEQALPPLPSSIRNGRSASCAKRTSGPPLLIGLTTACFRHRRRPSCAPLQFPLKSYGFPGAETARKRFLLWKMRFSAAKIAPSPPYTPPGTIEMRKGFATLFGFSTVCGIQWIPSFYFAPREEVLWRKKNCPPARWRPR